MTTGPRSLTAVSLLLLVLCLPLHGCGRDKPGDIQLADLNQGEYRYVSRMVVLERAKAVALNDRDTGEALLDSLAIAWGDSALPETAAGVPDDPIRAQLVGRLLGRILEAELDSLLFHPRPDRLAAPLPDPAPARPVARQGEEGE